MLNISGIHEGFVLDHIQAGMSLQIYHDLKLDKLDCTVAIIKNAKSNKMGKKDIIKVECPVEALDLDILGFIDHNITVNVIKGDTIVEKKILTLPKQVKNVIKCKSPRCVTSIEQELDQIFIDFFKNNTAQEAIDIIIDNEEICKHENYLGKRIAFYKEESRFEPRQRTALDGKVWWVVYDRYKQEFSSLTCFGKYKTKKDCQWAIDNKKEVM